MGIVRRAAMGALLAATVTLPALAAGHDPAVLTITGPNGVTELTMPDLMEMESTSFTTTTIWSEGPQDFIGVSLLAFVEELGLEEGTILAKAINDYAVEIPLSDAVEGGPIIAYLRNGEPMPVRDKGPLWLVYPYDLNPDYQSEVIFSRSIWQLDRIEILP